MLLMLSIIAFNVGCGSKSTDSKIAYISPNINSQYNNTFKDLQLGQVFDFNLELPNANKSWVYLWVEAYSNGKAVEPFPLTQLSYGLSPNQVEKGPVGLGILNPNSDRSQFFLYSKGIKTNNVESSLISKSHISIWDYALGEQKKGLESGEEVILAVYRQGEESLRAGYDYQDIDSVNKMIQEDTNVILLKIKVEEKQ